MKCYSDIRNDLIATLMAKDKYCHLDVEYRKNESDKDQL